MTAEDLRLLLNGVGDINVSTLISYTTFNDESSESGEKLIKFKRWLWSIVEKMSNLERQDLVSFYDRTDIRMIVEKVVSPQNVTSGRNSCNNIIIPPIH